MKHLPKDNLMAEAVYALNEKGTGGFFPVGRNHSWHSGIHISRARYNLIYPLARGTLAALRINENCKTIKRHKEISKEEFDRLPYNIREFYHPITAPEEQYMDEGHKLFIKELMKIYELKDATGGSEEKYSSGFALVRHSISLPARGSGEYEQITFFSLYTNLRPTSEYVYDSLQPDTLPFYLEWKEGRACIREEYRGSVEFDKVNATGIPLTAQSCLGLAAQNDNLDYVYDLAVFMRDVSFMDSRNIKAVPGYRIPPETRLYTREPLPQYFPAGTVLKILEERDFEGRKACRVTVKEMNMYFPLSGLDPKEKAETVEFHKIVSAPRQLYFPGSRKIDFTAEPLTRNADIFGFAAACAGIRERLVGKTYKRAKGEASDAKSTVLLRVNFDSFREPFITYWFWEDELPGTGRAGKEITLGGERILFSVNFQEAFRPLVRRGLLAEEIAGGKEISREYHVQGDGVQTAYLKFPVGEGEPFYIAEEDARQFKTDYSDWKAFFTRAEDSKNDLFCNIQKDVLRHLKLEGAAGDLARRIQTPEELIAGVFHSPPGEAGAVIRTELRRLVCRHPLEWDAGLYKDIENTEGGYFRYYSKSEDDLRYLKEKTAGMDIWQGIKDIEGIGGEKKLWFFHPIYFINHLDILYHASPVNNLTEAQDIVLNSPMYKPNAIGPFGRAGDTWCNYSTYDVLEATGFHTEGLYNSGSARSTSANDAAKNLIEMEKRGKVVELSPQEAQQKANEGYTVIVAWYNKTIPSETNQNGTAEYHGHLSTVRPNPKEGYDDSDGPLLANIGSDVEKLSTFFVFGNAYRVRNEIKFYYDPNQDFVFRENKMWCKGEGR